MTNDLRLIHTQGLDEGIRCAMCTNTMKSDKGCDGGCVVDQKMYEKVLKVIDKALEQQPSDGNISDPCDGCRYELNSTNGNPCYSCGKYKLTEQQPCEDTEVIKVSKGAVKARQGRFVIYDVDWLKENFYTTEEKIYGQPKQPCNEDYPTCTECEHYDKDKHYCPRFCQVIKDTLAEAQPCEDCISRQKALDCFEQTNTRQGAKYAIETLPSVTPQRPKGKWKRIAGFEDCNYSKCSVCGVYQLFYYGKPSTNYCPNCGAEMNGGGEDEDGKSL